MLLLIRKVLLHIVWVSTRVTLVIYVVSYHFNGLLWFILIITTTIYTQKESCIFMCSPCVYVFQENKSNKKITSQCSFSENLLLKPSSTIATGFSNKHQPHQNNNWTTGWENQHKWLRTYVYLCMHTCLYAWNSNNNISRVYQGMPCIIAEWIKPRHFLCDGWSWVGWVDPIHWCWWYTNPIDLKYWFMNHND